jgi:biopolymer transport protein ExbB
MRTIRFPSAVSWSWAAAIVTALQLALGATAALAQDAGAGKAGEADFSFFTVWILGGGGIGFIFVLPIEVCSIATLAAVIEHFVTLQRDRLVPPEVVVELETLLDEGQHEQALRLCDAAKNYITAIVGAALARAKDGREAMLDAAAAATDEQNLKLQHKISWLPLFGSIGPLMGLFGTVVGMVMAFTQIAQSAGTPSPQDLAKGIFTALVTTVWGLLVAMPATFFSYVFKMRVQRLSFELSGVALEIVEGLKPAAAPQVSS